MSVLICCCGREAECASGERPARSGGLDVPPHRERQTHGASALILLRHREPVSPRFIAHVRVYPAGFGGGFPGLSAGVGILRGAQSAPAPAVFGEQEGDPADPRQTRPQPPTLPQPGVEARRSGATSAKHTESERKHQSG